MIEEVIERVIESYGAKRLQIFYSECPIVEGRLECSLLVDVDGTMCGREYIGDSILSCLLMAMEDSRVQRHLVGKSPADLINGVSELLKEMDQ